jgi:hypothetical protein
MSAGGAMKRSIPILAACALLVCAANAGAETIPPDHWAYEALRSFELRGLVALEPTLPCTRDRMEAYVREISRGLADGRVELGSRQRFLLERLEREFAGKGGRPEDRDDRPALTIRDGERFAAIDAAAGGAILKRVDRERGEANGLGEVAMLADFGRGITMETSCRLAMAPEWGNNADGGRPGPRTRSFRGFTGEFERALAAANGSWWELRFGREYLHWGGDDGEGLLLSRTAGSLDHFGGRVALGRFALSAFHAALGRDRGLSYHSRYLAGHRLTAALPRGVFVGVSETVLYGGTHPEWTYSLPLGIFYATQANERTNSDNVLYSFDVKAPLARGAVLSAELLVDDIQYERGDGSGPDRIAFTIGVDAQRVMGGREYGLSARYTYVDIYTYEHGYMRSFGTANTDYVAGDGTYPWNAIIGSALGPDADRWDLAASCGASERLDMRLDASFIRRGEGNDLRSWHPGRESDPPFPSGDALRETWIAASCSYDLGRGSRVAASGGVRLLGGGPADLDSANGFARLELVLDP